MHGRLVVISGFSGSGKDTLVNMLLEKRGDFKRIVTHTSRPKRQGQKEGWDYYFISKTKFETMIQNNMFVEHVLYGTHYKGTSKEEFQKVLQGENLLWRIDLGRAATLEETFREKFDEKIYKEITSRIIKIAITVSPQEALERYQNREGNKADVSEFQKRLNQDLEIWNKYIHNFPHIVENITGKIEKTFENVLEIINKYPSY